MFTRLILLTSLLTAPLAYFLIGETSAQHPPYIQGNNKTVLFITNSEHGLSNVHLATASALLEKYPDIQIHYASFPNAKQRVERISSFSREKAPEASDIVFHELKGLTFAQTIIKEGRSFISPPGWAGIAALTEHIQLWLSPWTSEDHINLVQELDTIIDHVDPAVVVLDVWYRPAIDVTRKKNRQHAFISPNTLVDHFLGIQPLWNRFWKYPAPSSGFAFPVPLRDIPENVYMNLRCIYSFMFTPDLSAKKAFLKEQGLDQPINLFGIHRPDAPWITQNTEGAMVSVEFVPPNVTCAGPILLSGAPAAQQDPELAAWLKRSPTVLISLGTALQYDQSRAVAMAIAIAELLSKSDVQVLWKFNKLGEYSDDFLVPLKPYLGGGRLRASNWLVPDPSSLLETGDIIASVHHGGSSCYHEAIGAGLPQVVLPLWADLYNYAALAETAGVGVWGCKATTPGWTSDCLATALLQLVDGGQVSVSLTRHAKELGDKVKAGDKGRDIAAREIAKLAYLRLEFGKLIKQQSQELSYFMFAQCGSLSYPDATGYPQAMKNREVGTKGYVTAAEKALGNPADKAQDQADCEAINHTYVVLIEHKDRQAHAQQLKPRDMVGG
ncbi:hypothetical protein FSARC_5399 [Fusarium sarcochroum]|uniref:Glycosyltransferase n=1 Tax=Fusarium sarcochroum TaxID=1208366 RepID=A0A8H4XAH2_9HYPO|nr:hypothetical protein FSARC_5399 [Fusarium sarcochroum]